MKRTLKSLNILKGIAMIMIIIVHNRHFIFYHTDGIFRQLINFGQMGVPIFFMVSGMALCYSWTNQCKVNPSQSLSNYCHFVKKRYLRLAPGFLIILALNLLLNFVLIDILHYSPGYIMNREPLGLLVNILFLHGLFPEYINSVFPSGWYIGSTFLLYLLFPVLFWLFQKIRQKNKHIILILPILFCLLYYVFTKQIALYSSNTIYPYNCSFLYFFFLNQLPSFSVGIMLFFHEEESFSAKCPLWITLLLGVFFILFAFYLYLQPDVYCFFTIIPFLVSIASYWFALFLLHIEHCKGFPSCLNAITGFIANCGTYSYEMYLMHGFFSWYAIKALTLYLTGQGIVYNDLLLYIILLPVTIFLVYSSGRLLSVFLNKINTLMHKKKSS